MLNLNKYTSYLPRKTGMYLGGLALGLTALLVPGCNDDVDIEPGQTNVTTEDLTTDSLEDAKGAGGYDIVVGQSATIRGMVQEEISDQAFLIEGEDGGSVLIINSPETPMMLPDQDTPVQVTGEVVQFVIADLESEFDLDGELFVDYEQEPAIIAQSIALAPTPEQLAEEDTTPYYDQTIAVEGDVGGIYSDDTFSLYEDGWIDDQGILVIGVDRALEAQGSPLEEGESVTVTGELMDFDLAVLEQDYDLGWSEEVAAEFEEKYTDRPVIVAEGVYPSAVDD